MKRIFEKVKTKCAVCETPVDGRYKRGDLYYCASDYEKTSPEELRINVKTEKDYKDHLKLYQ